MRSGEFLAVFLLTLLVIGAASAAVVTSSWNNGEVENAPPYPSEYTFEKPFHLLSLETYHWNDGRGGEQPGSLAIIDKARNVHGP